jgi:Rad3-related DNA helicase
MFKARRQALDAQFVVTNHAMLFSNVIASGSLLGPYDVLVIDEAHHLENVATDFYSLSYSPYAIRGAQHSIYSPALDETVKYIMAMAADESAGDAEAIEDLWKLFHDALDAADKSTAEMFSVLGKNATHVVGARSKSGAGRNAYEINQAVYQEGAPLLYGIDTPVADVSRALGRMEAAVERILEIVISHDSLAESGANGALRAIRDSTLETRAEFDFLVAGSSEDHVFHARLGRGTPSSGADTALALAASPVDVSARLGSTLEDGCQAAVLTSATLAVDGDFAFTLKRFGLDRCSRADTLSYESPFDLDNRRAVLLAAHMPDPGDRSFVSAAADIIESVSAACDRRVLVLCTARNQVTALADLLLSTRDSGNDEVFAQSEGASRKDLLARFKRSHRGILVGLASFWEGIDLPGDDLELLVILKLPFLVPSEPITQARSKRIADSGEDAFEKLFIPDVVLKLRQGMGRLIRSGGDRGAVLILDRRLWHSRYGESVLRAVTNKYVRSDERVRTIEYLVTFFE